MVGLRAGRRRLRGQPFSVRELVLRVGALLRARAMPVTRRPSPRYLVGPLEIDAEATTPCQRGESAS